MVKYTTAYGSMAGRTAAAAAVLTLLAAPVTSLQPRAPAVRAMARAPASSRRGGSLYMTFSIEKNPLPGSMRGVDGYPLDPLDRLGKDGLAAGAGLGALSGISGASAGLSSSAGTDRYPIQQAFDRMESDVYTLENVVDNTAQLSTTEFSILSATIATALFSPFLLATKVVEVLIPTMAALSAAVGISAEYVGKVAVANGKEIAAVSLMAAAEAEVGLAAAERAKAVIPLTVGASATATAFALLAPALLEDLGVRYGVVLVSELYLIPPLLSVLAAAVAGLAAQETGSLARRAVSIGNRRFAKANSVGNSWLSASEQVAKGSVSLNSKWSTFILASLPAPLLGALCPGPVSFKAIVCAAVAAAQAAYYLAGAEYELARTMDAVALKTRTAALADTYANQGARSGSILPFTSALTALCAAATAAVVEVLPLLPNIETEAAVGAIFPTVGALFAAAASVSKARCEVDAAAASTAADSFADRDNQDKDVSYQNLEPVRGVWALIKLTTKSLSKTTARIFRNIPFLGGLFGDGRKGSSAQYAY